MLELRTNPENQDSQTYKMNVPIFKDNMSIEEFLIWRKNLKTVLDGMNITAPKDKLGMAARLLAGRSGGRGSSICPPSRSSNSASVPTWVARPIPS